MEGRFEWLVYFVSFILEVLIHFILFVCLFYLFKRFLEGNKYLQGIKHIEKPINLEGRFDFFFHLQIYFFYC